MASENLPRVTIPAESGEYKVIQLEGKLDGTAYLRFGQEPDNPCEFHMDILERFGEESGYCLNEEVFPPMLPDNAPYMLVGAGRCRLNLEGRTASFGSGSTNYKIEIDQGHLQRIRAELPEWNVR